MIENLTAASIAKLAFEGAIRAGAGKLTEGAIDKSKNLWETIKAKFKGNPMVEEAIKDAEEQLSMEIVEKYLVSQLEFAMSKDLQFAEEIQKIAQEINSEINDSSQNDMPITDCEVGDNSVFTNNFKAEQVDSIGGSHIGKK